MVVVVVVVVVVAADDDDSAFRLHHCWGCDVRGGREEEVRQVSEKRGAKIDDIINRERERQREKQREKESYDMNSHRRRKRFWGQV